MTTLMWRHLGLALITVAMGNSPRTWAALPIDVEVATQPGVPLTAPQEWARLLGEMELGRVRVRQATSADVPEVTKVEGTVGARFKVVALLNGRGELVLPSRLYRVSDRKLLGNYFRSLSSEESFGEDRGRFDLTEKQFRQVHADLSRVIDFSTKSQTPVEVLSQLVDKFVTPIQRDPASVAILRQASSLEVELRGMAAGTGLAIALRQESLVLRPEKLTGKPLHMIIEPQRAARDAWPIGWKFEASPRVVAPQMFEFLTIEIDGYTLAKALDALEPRLGVALVYDRRILAEREIQPDKIQVKLPPGKTYLKKAVDRLLSQARLAGELRVDEAGRPFYWITQFGNDSPRAE